MENTLTKKASNYNKHTFQWKSADRDCHLAIESPKMAVTWTSSTLWLKLLLMHARGHAVQYSQHGTVLSPACLNPVIAES